MRTFQSTFPRGERHPVDKKERLINGISIHVPAWGTTISRMLGTLKPIISIHVPAWGTTTLCLLTWTGQLISIHVPAWGTTSSGKSYLRVYSVFQSTFPRGERRIPMMGHPKLILYFNPRSRVGNDLVCDVWLRVDIISIHVPAWGTTWLGANGYDNDDDFNPRSRVGND